MLIAHKSRLKPHKVQATYFARAAGTARFAYHWALAQWCKQGVELDNTLPKPSQMLLRQAWNAIKGEEFPWIRKVTKSAAQEAIIQQGPSFQNFFAGRAKYPKFRNKRQHDRFSISNDLLSVTALCISLPRLGWVGRCEALRFAGKVCQPPFPGWQRYASVEVLDYTSTLRAPKPQTKVR